MKRTLNVMNELLVDLFNDILTIEQNTLKKGIFNDLSITEMHTIEAIGMYDSKTMSQVAKNLGITVGTLTKAIKNLVKKNYVQRKRGEQDRRTVNLILTKRGKVAYRMHSRFHRDMIRATIEDMTEEEEQVMLKALDKLNMFFRKNIN
ncbi:MAG: MarR family transcriptional regulator [Clostridium sp.]|nr:MarR family transcriptional regulator [Clostridium sp.]